MLSKGPQRNGKGVFAEAEETCSIICRFGGRREHFVCSAEEGMILLVGTALPDNKENSVLC